MYMAESEHARKRQQELKETLRTHLPDRVVEYASLAQLSDMVARDLERVIELEFPVQGTGRAGREAHWSKVHYRHEAFAESKTLGYIPPSGMFERLERYCADGGAGHGIAVVGDSGIGKSALLANWARHHQAAHPRSMVFAHYVGCTRESTAYAQVLLRLAVALSEHFQLDVRVGGMREMRDMGQVLDLVRDSVRRAAACAETRGEQIVWVVDGLDRVEGTGAGGGWGWVPVSTHVRMVCSMQSTTWGAGEDTRLEGVQWGGRSWSRLPLRELRETEQRAMIAAYLATHAKRLDVAQTDLFLRVRHCANPLYLRTLLDEARLHGDFDSLTQYLTTLLRASSLAGLYALMLHRLDGECGQELVVATLACIYCSRDGLEDDELREVLLSGTPAAPPLQWAFDADVHSLLLVQLLYAIREHLCTMSGRLVFLHSAMRRAVLEHVRGKVKLSAVQAMLEESAARRRA